jgi:hypothetical protein
MTDMRGAGVGERREKDESIFFSRKVLLHAPAGAALPAPAACRALRYLVVRGESRAACAASSVQSSTRGSTMWVVVAIEGVLVALLVLYLYNIYASYERCARALFVPSRDAQTVDRCRRPWYVTGAVLLGWYASFSLVILIPTDVTSVRHAFSCGVACLMQNIQTRHEDCVRTHNGTAGCDTPWLYVSIETRRVLWEVLYWTTFVTTW